MITMDLAAAAAGDRGSKRGRDRFTIDLVAGVTNNHGSGEGSDR
jgi:hypothetical protein